MAITKSRIFSAAASAARTTSSNSGAIGVVENFDEMLVCLEVSAASAADTLDLAYQVSPDGGATWITHTAFAQVTAAGTALLKLENLGTLGRIAWTIGGASPSFTFAVWLVCKRRG
jgi:hypothetical protein